MEEISIVEKTNFGARTWVISDVDGEEKGFLLRSSGEMLGNNYWMHFDSFVEDGSLITAVKIFQIARRKVALDHWAIGPLDQCLVMDYIDSFSTDEQGNLVREFNCSMPIADIKITIVMSAVRISDSREKLSQCGSIAVRKVFDKIRKVFARGYRSIPIQALRVWRQVISCL